MTKEQYQQVVYDTARKCGLNDVQAKIIVSQATHESGNFSSNVFKTDNNAFGLKMPSKRPRTYIARASNIVMRAEGSTPYAHYSSLQQCITDLIKGWHVYNKTDWSKLQTPEQYAAYLKSKSYYGDSQENYTAALKRFFSKLGWLKTAAPILLPILLFSAIAIYYYSKR